MSGTIALDPLYGQIKLLDEVTVSGPGAGTLAVSGGGESRIFYARPGIGGDDFDPVSISGLTLADGFIGGNDSGGALYSYMASVTIADSVLADNDADLNGGAVYVNNGTLSIAGSAFDGNRADGGGGGAVYVDDTPTTGSDSVDVAVSDSIFTGNYAGSDGGALYFEVDGGLVVERTTVSGNEADGIAGGIYVQYVGSGGELTIDATTISGNTGGERAGGMYVDDVTGDALIDNSTISGNSAYYEGGGVYFRSLNEDSETTFRNSSIVGNVAGVDPDEDRAGGGIYVAGDNVLDGNGPITVASTIVANNSADSGADLAAGEFADGFDIGFSLIESAPVGPVTEVPAGSNLFGVDPQLGPLTSNGGPTQTHLPGVGSPAIDKGIASGLATDQRGLARTADLSLFPNATGGDGTDIGSVEIQAADCRGAGALKIDGTGGDDSIVGTDGPDSIAALAGNDTADGGGGNDCVSGDDGNDSVKGGPGADLVSGGAGKDKASGGGGKDKVKGQSGKDNLKGGGGKDRLAGAGGKDKLSGGGGKDRLKGGPGKDKLAGGGGKDRFNCGGGKDKVTAQPKDKVSASCETVVERG